MPLMFFLQSNPLTPIYNNGAATGSAIIAVGLFIWSQIQISIFKKNVEDNTKVITESNRELRGMIIQQAEAQEKLAESVQKLAEAVKGQSDRQSEQLELIRDMAGEQKLLMANQVTIMNGFQRVVEQLIQAVRE